MRQGKLVLEVSSVDVYARATVAIKVFVSVTTLAASYIPNLYIKSEVSQWSSWHFPYL